MERQSFAYLIMIVMAAALIGWGLYRWYHGRERTYRRRQTREAADHDKRMEEDE